MSDWRDRAACLDEDPELFHPVPSDTDLIDEAKAVCRRCPVIDACLTEALERNEFGVWGGLSEDERRKVRRKEKRKSGTKPNECGTRKGYQSHIRRGEKACQRCKDAEAASSRERRAQRARTHASSRPGVGTARRAS